MQSKTKPRRRHGDQFKEQVLRACAEPGASVAAVARAHGLNDNLVHQWRRGRGVRSCTPVVEVSPTGQEVVPNGFIALPVSVPTPAPESIAPAAALVAGVGDICLQIKRGAVQVSVSWPRGDAAACAAWLREVLR
jgi:transposase